MWDLTNPLNLPRNGVCVGGGGGGGLVTVSVFIDKQQPRCTIDSRPKVMRES